ncbi:MAG: cytochrome c-type biogenesis protein [Caulobacteraceae bacterium]
MNKGRLAAALAAILCMAQGLAPVGDPADRLPNAAQETRAESLFREFRCLVCQGESIAESNAPLAGDLRLIVRQQVAEGRTNSQIRAWMEARYGPFVLLRPPFTLTNALLWGAPFAAAALGVGLLIARRKRGESEDELTKEEEARIERIGIEPGS